MRAGVDSFFLPGGGYPRDRASIRPLRGCGPSSSYSTDVSPSSVRGPSPASIMDAEAPRTLYRHESVLIGELLEALWPGNPRLCPFPSVSESEVRSALRPSERVCMK